MITLIQKKNKNYKKITLKETHKNRKLHTIFFSKPEKNTLKNYTKLIKFEPVSFLEFLVFLGI